MDDLLRVLIVEDNTSDAELMVRHLTKEGFRFNWTRIENEQEYIRQLDIGGDLILSDWSLPDFSGLRALEIIHEQNKDIPFIIVSGSIGEEAAIEALHFGVSDYLLKDRPDRLGPAVSRALLQKKMQDERKLAEEKLRCSEERFREVAESAGEWIWEVDANGLYVYNSPVVEKILGYLPEELVSQIHFYDLFAPEDSGSLKQIFLDKIANKQTLKGIVNKNISKDGRQVILETNGTPLLDENGNLNGYRGMSLDITEKKATEKDLFNSQEKYRYLVEMSPDAIAVYRNGLIDFVNPAAVELLGAQNAGQLVDMPYINIIHPDYHTIVRDRIRKTSQDHIRVGLIEEKIIRLDGSQRDVEAIAAPFLDNLGYSTQVIFRDVTERKQAAKLLAEASQELEKAYNATLQGWSKALELREHETAGHSQRVVKLTLDLAQAMDIPAEEFIHIQRGALLHDIGKMGIPDNILLKPGPLSDDEWVIMRKHPLYAYDLLSKIPYLSASLDIPHYHHERWNGSGYPEGLSGTDIPLTARIFAVVDIWDALSFDRPYRNGWCRDKVVNYLQEQAGILLDPDIVGIFLELV